MKARRKPLLKNSLETGKVYYGLHMHEGVAHYKPPGQKPFTVFVGNQTIKLMNSTFLGKPVYVGHVDEHTKLTDADGVVCDSFYNKADGNHWSKFVVTTQKGENAIQQGWKLSNSFLVDKQSRGGQWHGLDYEHTVDQGTFHHLAIVPDPRYAESIILTPEEFKQYNNEKEAELIRLANSKETTMMKIFKKTKVDNSKDINLEELYVTLPKKKREVSLAVLVNEADEAPAAPAEQEIDIDGAKMTLSQFVEMYKKLKAEFDSIEFVDGDEVESLANAADADDEAESEDDTDLDDSSFEEDEDEDEEADEETETPAKVDNSVKAKKAIKKVQGQKTATKLKNAADKAGKGAPARVVDLRGDQFKRGSDRYGSKK